MAALPQDVPVLVDWLEQHAGETAPLRVIAGTYGCRQGLSMDATCGPFVHMLDL